MESSNSLSLALFVALAVVLSRAHVTLTKRIGELDLGTIKTRHFTDSDLVNKCVHRARSKQAE